MNLQHWLEVATRGLGPAQAERIALEVGAHLEEARDHLMASGVSKEEAQQKALEALGDPLVASRAFLATYSRPFLPQSLATIAYLLLSFPLGILYFVVMVVTFSVGLSLAWTYVGLPILALAFAASWGFATVERSLSAAFLGVYVARRPSPEPKGTGLWARAKAHVTHSGTWLDIGYLFLRFPLGILAFVAAVVLVVVPLALIFVPFAELIWGSSGGMEYSYLWPWLDRFIAANIATGGWLSAVEGVLLLPVSLYVLNWLAAFYGQLSQHMLGNGAAGFAHRLNNRQTSPIIGACLASAVAMGVFFSSPITPFPVPSMAVAAGTSISEEKVLNLQGVSQLELRTDVATIAVVGNQSRSYMNIKRWGNQTYIFERQGEKLIFKEQWVRNCRNCKAEIEVYLSQAPGLLVRNNVGLIKLENLGNPVNVGSDSGSLILRQISGPITARANSGTITVDGARQGVWLGSDAGDIQISQVEGELRAKSNSGDIKLSTVRGTLELGSDSGDISAQQTVGPLRASTNSGGIEVNEAQGLLELKTDAGDIVVRKAAGQLQVSSNAGEIRLEEVQLNPGAANRLKTDAGSIWITALNTPTGLLLQGRKDSGKLQVDLPRANTQIADSRFEVKLPGTNPVRMEVVTNAGAIRIK